jgi:predicted nucleic acid-binding protein
MPIYLDTNVFIAAVEGDQADVRSAIWRLFAASELRGGVLVTSELSIAELLVKPLELELAAVVATYSELLTDGHGLIVIPVDRDVLVRAAHIRKDDKAIRLPDDIHLATADRAGCSVILTNDKRLTSKRPSSCRSVLVDTVDSISRELA